MAGDSIAIISTGGQNPGVYNCIFTNGNITFKKIIPYPQGSSVYRIAFNSDQSRLACVDKVGHIKIFFRGDSLACIAEFLHLTSQLPMVTGLIFMGNDLLVSAGSDFKLKAYNLNTQDLFGELTTSGIVFGLKEINSELFCGIARDHVGDHLVVWNIFDIKEIYRGPVFKIASFYLNTMIDFDPRTGLVAHGDRSGQMHIYELDNNFKHKVIQTPHNNFYGVLFNGDNLFSAGDADCKLIRWSLVNFEKVDEFSLSAPIHWLTRTSVNSILAGMRSGQVALINHENEMNKEAINLLQDIRHMAGPSKELIDNLSSSQHIKTGKELLKKIQLFFESEKPQDAYELIKKLEQQGFKSEAMQALAIAEKAQGHILDELEVLFMMVYDKQLDEKNINYFKRIAEILEIIHEPELAITFYLKIASDFPEMGADEQNLEKLKKRCVKDEGIKVALAGYSNPVMISAEIRKAQILNRYFETPIVIKEDIHKTVPHISIESLAEALRSDGIPGVSEIIVESILWKRGFLIIKSAIIKIISDNPDFSSHQCWVEFRCQMNEERLITYTVFDPGEYDGTKDWNLETINRFKEVSSSPAAKNWYIKVIESIKKVLPVALDTNGETDDQMFT